MTTLRRDITTLTDSEWRRFADALNAYKAATDPETGMSLYDLFTKRHMESMMELTLFPGETGTQRNAAHRGPVFLPWHRVALRDLELDLQRPEFDPWGPLLSAYYDAAHPPEPLAIPYCRFFGMGNTWQTHAVWERIGHNGSSAQGRRVVDGPFAHWTSVIWNDGTQSFVPRAGILRNFRSGSIMPGVPNVRARANAVYDAYPWSELTTTGFRNMLESRHNTVHNIIGGDMLAGTSPNDPVFWLHHCNVDRYWAAWQQVRGMTNYAPNGEGPPGHNRYDQLSHTFLPVTVDEAMDLEASDVAYDSLA